MQRSKAEICGTCKFYMETKPGNYCMNPESGRSYRRAKKDCSCERWARKMNALSEYIHRPKITLDGREYVDKESFKELIVQKIISEIKDSESQDERTGLEMCIQIIGNL